MSLYLLSSSQFRADRAAYPFDVQLRESNSELLGRKALTMAELALRSAEADLQNSDTQPRRSSCH